MERAQAAVVLGGDESPLTSRAALGVVGVEHEGIPVGGRARRELLQRRPRVDVRERGVPSTISAACTPSYAVATAFRCESVDATSTDCIPPPFSSQCFEETHHAASVSVHAETAVMFACGRSIERDSPSSEMQYVGGRRWRGVGLPSAAESSVV